MKMNVACLGEMTTGSENEGRASFAFSFERKKETKEAREREGKTNFHLGPKSYWSEKGFIPSRKVEN